MLKPTLSLLALLGCAAAQAQTLTPLDLSAVNGIASMVTAPSHQVAYAGVNATGAAHSTVYGKTTDGGLSWTTHTVPETAARGFSSIHALTDDLVWASLSSNTDEGGAVWGSQDGGTTWAQLTTTEFANGYVDLCYFATPDSGVAVGDPVDGYLEIHTTSNGGATWTRTPEADIPAMETGETPVANSYDAVGHRIWINTTTGRILMSYDLGATWIVSASGGPDDALANVTFADALNGAYHHMYHPNVVHVTVNGGQSWMPLAVDQAWEMILIHAVRGAPGTYLFTTYPGSLWATVDEFQSVTLLDQASYSTARIVTFDATIGWLAKGVAAEDSAMYRIDGVVNSVRERGEAPTALQVFPNPATNGAALVTMEMGGATEGTLSVADLQGRIVHTVQLRGSGRLTRLLELGDLAPGSHLLILRTKVATLTTRLVVN